MKNLRLGLGIALRYFISKQRVQVINIISWISVAAVAILATAMITLLSVLNGFELLLQNLYTAFYSDIKISAARGKWMDVSQEQLQKLSNLPGVAHLSRGAEDMVLLITKDRQRIATLKGVEEEWFAVNRLDTFITDGATGLAAFAEGQHPAIFGKTIAGDIGINVNNPYERTTIYYPQAGVGGLAAQQSLSTTELMPVGLFSVQSEFDGRYIITTLQTAEQLFGIDSRVSSIELSLSPDVAAQTLKSQIATIMGSGVKVESRFEQNRTHYLIMQSEKLAVYVILTFVLVIASFTMIGVLSMVVIDKRKDMSVLRAMGLPDAVVRYVFIFQGLLLTTAGGIAGLFVGWLLCLGQMRFGWVKLEEGFIIDDYPVHLEVYDFVKVLLIIMVVGFLASLLPAQKAKKQAINFREE